MTRQDCLLLCPMMRIPDVDRYFVVPSVQEVCGTFVVRMWYVCGTYVVRMWYVCGTFVVHMWYVCGTYNVISMW